MSTDRSPNPRAGTESRDDDAALARGELQQLWADQVAWQTRVRWGVPLVIFVAVVVGLAIGYEFAAAAILAVACTILAYNLAFHVILRRAERRGVWAAAAARRIDLWQVAFDYAAMFLLIHFTGGPASPLLFLFLLHVIFAAILFRPPVTWSLALAVCAGVFALSALEYMGVIAHYPVAFDGRTTDLLAQPEQVFALLSFFAATVIATAASTAIVMERYRGRIRKGFEAEQTLIDERSRFMLRVAHDVRAPLSAASSMLDLLRQGYLGDVTSEQQEYIERVHHRLVGAMDIVNDLLALARHRERAAAISRDEVALQPLLENVAATYRDHALSGYVGLSVHPCEGAPVALGDAAMLEQLLDNLVSNAIKYTPAGGEVEVSAVAEGQFVRLQVLDTGIGIPAAEQGSLFAEFYRASNARELSAVGTGLGLAIVKQIVDQHGGTIALESVEGSGTCVTVELPAARRSADS